MIQWEQKLNVIAWRVNVVKSLNVDLSVNSGW